MSTRRDFLRLAAGTAAASMLPPSIRRALAIPANRRTGTIQDVEHVVILMQENRSFDHYFGSMRGVRGFNDPRPVRWANGRTVWHQPAAAVKTDRYHSRGLSDDAEHVLPFYINPQRTTEFQAGTDHGWSSGHLSWNHGLHNQWVTQKQDVMTMGYLKREDVSYHYALADAFTVCDSYFCSIHANTAPNRIYLWSGTIDAQNVYGTAKNGPGFDERHHQDGYTWTTYPERLEKAGVSWKLYQGGSGEPDTPTDNYTDNSLEFFAAYQPMEGADPNSPLVVKGVSTYTLKDLRDDAVNGKLAQVSWVVAPYKYSEHPEASPTDGAYYISLVMDALTENPEVWSKTVFIINYDENDGLFDHVIPPMPPASQKQNADGLVSDDLVESLKDEFIDMSLYPHQTHPLVPDVDAGGIQPIGLGPRLPMLVISPWSTGGWVNSETFDHTSVLMFLEARFGVHEPNISKWRRTLCGDLTSCFDFSAAPQPMSVKLTAPKPLVSENKPYHVPVEQSMPEQEPGTRPARALPYKTFVHGRIDEASGRFYVDIDNQGRAGAAFYVHSSETPQTHPRRYSVSPRQKLSDYWELAAMKDGRRLSAHGPNGYLAEFGCDAADFSEGAARAEVTISHDAEGNVQAALHNSGKSACTVKVVNAYSKEAARTYTLQPGQSTDDKWLLADSHGWFDLVVMRTDAPKYLRRFAGHVETGKPSVSDPGPVQKIEIV
ncbi:phosphocholine-specific phospholipase C [Silvibacterium acidisoli]|uniref:phosphocholine-specific phospholipase C n=1 Tax=Acidobacteriaceae bacterium ZG23-2 TaxID=2883246 RepID=UPI00406C8836